MAEKLDRIATSVASIDTNLAVQSVVLKDLAKRTNRIEGELVPLKAHVERGRGVFKFIGVLCLIVGTVAAVAAVVK